MPIFPKEFPRDLYAYITAEDPAQKTISGHVLLQNLRNLFSGKSAEELFSALRSCSHPHQKPDNEIQLLVEKLHSFLESEQSNLCNSLSDVEMDLLSNFVSLIPIKDLISDACMRLGLDLFASIGD